MSPFGAANGGPLDDEQIDSIVAFIRSWEANPPVELPPEIISATPSTPSEASLSGSQIYVSVCSSCHGVKGEGGIGPALNTQDFQDKYDDKAMFDVIDTGHDATSMIAWGEILTSDQITQLVKYIRALNADAIDVESVSFSGQVAPLFQAKCQMCHNQTTALGGWNSTSYEAVTTSGSGGSVVIPGDIANSILAQRVSGTEGAIMPPSGKMSDAEVQIILNWIAAGVPEN